jgi:PilZ domain
MDRMNLQGISLLWAMSAALEKVAKNDDAPADRMNSDNRISARYVFEARILIRFSRGSQTFATQGWARDLSESGLGAFVGENLVVGELVTLQIPLGVSGKELITAKVCRHVGTHYGFQFIALSSEQRLGIQAVQKKQKEIPNWHAKS